jgi:hypothetical protein
VSGLHCSKGTYCLQEPFTQWHRITSQKTRILNYTSVKKSKLDLKDLKEILKCASLLLFGLQFSAVSVTKPGSI